MVSIRANALAGIAAAIAVMLAPATAHADNAGSITSPANGNTVKAGTSLTVGANVTNVCDAKVTVTTPGGDTQPVANAPTDPLCAPVTFTGKFTPATAGSYTLTLAAGKGAVIDTVTITATAPATPTATPTATATPTETPSSAPTETVTITATPSPSPSVVATTKLPSTKKTATAKPTTTATAKPRATTTVTATPALVYVTPPAPAPQPQVVIPQVQAPAPEATMPEAAAPQVAAPAPASDTPSASGALGMKTVSDDASIGDAIGAMFDVLMPIVAIAGFGFGFLMMRRTKGAHAAPNGTADPLPKN